MSINIDIDPDDAKQLRAKWDMRRAVLKTELDALVKKIAQLDEQLSNQLNLLPHISTEQKNGKRKKGSIAPTIQKYLASVLADGATVRQISEATGIPVSSCDAALKSEKNQNMFFRSHNGTWHMKPRAVKVEV